MRTLIALLLLLCATAQAQAPSQAIEQTLKLNREARAAQQQIDSVYAQRERVIEELNLVKQTGSTYALQQQLLEQQLAQVRAGLAAVAVEMTAVIETQTGLLRLLTAMVDALDQFVTLDLPFNQQQRRERMTSLRGSLLSAELSVTEKYQAVVAAYLDEIRAGSGSAVAQQKIDGPQGTRMVQLLRLGRAGLWYVTADGTQAGYWDPQQRRWTAGGVDPAEVLNGIRVVEQSAPPRRITLPLRLNTS